MITIKLHNTKTRSKEVFTPIDPTNVRMYVCGPTVYDRAHLGNARPVVVFDVLYRLLRHVYGSDHVTYVRNFTDVDDKINAEALRRQKAGSPGTLEDLIAERTEETIAWYHADMDALRALRPNHEPRATQYIEEMKEMIQILIAKGNAYVVRDGSNNPPQQYVLFDKETRNAAHTLFDVESYPAYGQLSGQSTKQMIAGSRGEKAPHKRNPTDFVLWKPSSDQEPGWESPWGRGRPGWHIECSAMAHKLLGESFDIHAGGIDLQFPHHENELAQSKCAHPHGEFARVWMHNEMLQVEGKKMSKSLGNFFTVRDLLDQGVPGEVIRFVLLSTHYGKPMDWTKEKAEQAHEALLGFLEITQGVDAVAPDPEVIDALADDLNTSLAIARLHALRKQGRGAELLASARLMGILDFHPTVGTVGWGELSETVRGQLTALAHRWATLRANLDFAAADELKARAELAGVTLRATKQVVGQGSIAERTSNFDPSKLESLK
jgi:cysteinyl-tRNA synthetase